MRRAPAINCLPASAFWHWMLATCGASRSKVVATCRLALPRNTQVCADRFTRIPGRWRVAATRYPPASRCSLWKQLPGTGLRLEAQRITHQGEEKSPFAIKPKRFGGHGVRDLAATYRAKIIFHSRVLNASICSSERRRLCTKFMPPKTHSVFLSQRLTSPALPDILISQNLSLLSP